MSTSIPAASKIPRSLPRRKPQHTVQTTLPHAGVRVRRGEFTDLDELLTLEERTFDSDRLSRSQYRRHLDSDSAQVLVASATHNYFLGAAVLLFRKRSTVARVYSLATHPQARRQGVAKALLQAAEQAARRRGCRALRLEVQVGNARAINLYERAGYACIGSRPHYYQDGADAWRFEKLLA
ncbi:MAG: N-acetyltransferase [Rhodanobacter sp.]